MKLIVTKLLAFDDIVSYGNIKGMLRAYDDVEEALAYDDEIS